jgi:adenylate kinase family enzyme
MRIMIIGDSASGKSTLSAKLGEKLGLEPWHLDVDMDKMGRHNRGQIGELIHDYVDRNRSWIIEGNAFTKDKTYRLEKSDVVVVCAPMRLVTFYRVVRRYWRQKAGRETRIGSEDEKLDLGYYIPYIFWKFPTRRRIATEYAQNLGKKVIRIKNYRAADSLLESNFWEA